MEMERETTDKSNGNMNKNECMDKNELHLWKTKSNQTESMEI